MKQKIVEKHVRRFGSLRRLLWPALAIALVAAMVACGSNGGGSSAAGTQLQVNMGDAPADRLVAFSMTINSMSLIGSGSTVNVISSPMTIEMMHLMGTMQPITMMGVPQGTYTGATMTIGSAVVTYMNPTTRNLVQKNVSGPINASMTLSPAMTVGSTPMALGLDMDMANSVSIDNSGNVTMNPTFRVSMGAGNSLDPTNGGVQHMVGMISGMSGSGFSMTNLQTSQSLNFMTNSSTIFSNMSGMGMMSNGQIMLVDASMQSDGSLLAQTVQSLMNAGGMMGEGFLISVTGTPATQLGLVMRNGIGGGVATSAFANSTTVNVGSGTLYRIDTDDMDMTGLPFTPAFDGSHIYAGQNMEALSGSTMMAGGLSFGMMGGSIAGTVTASQVDLEQQGFQGTVSNNAANGSGATFMLTLPSDSAFTTLTGGSSIAVFQRAGTALSGLTSVANGATVQVRGLLFFDGGTWKLVASRISGQ